MTSKRPVMRWHIVFVSTAIAAGLGYREGDFQQLFVICLGNPASYGCTSYRCTNMHFLPSVYELHSGSVVHLNIRSCTQILYRLYSPHIWVHITAWSHDQHYIFVSLSTPTPGLSLEGPADCSTLGISRVKSLKVLQIVVLWVSV